jgi:hypothetical protein
MDKNHTSRMKIGEGEQNRDAYGAKHLATMSTPIRARNSGFTTKPTKRVICFTP